VCTPHGRGRSRHGIQCQGLRDLDQGFEAQRIGVRRSPRKGGPQVSPWSGRPQFRAGPPGLCGWPRAIHFPVTGRAQGWSRRGQALAEFPSRHQRPKPGGFCEVADTAGTLCPVEGCHTTQLPMLPVERASSGACWLEHAISSVRVSARCRFSATGQATPVACKGPSGFIEGRLSAGIRTVLLPDGRAEGQGRLDPPGGEPSSCRGRAAQGNVVRAATRPPADSRPTEGPEFPDTQAWQQGPTAHQEFAGVVGHPSTAGTVCLRDGPGSSCGQRRAAEPWVDLALAATPPPGRKRQGHVAAELADPIITKLAHPKNKLSLHTGSTYHRTAQPGAPAGRQRRRRDGLAPAPPKGRPVNVQQRSGRGQQLAPRSGYRPRRGRWPESLSTQRFSQDSRPIPPRPAPTSRQSRQVWSSPAHGKITGGITKTS